jgi:hypothetical protein
MGYFAPTTMVHCNPLISGTPPPSTTSVTLVVSMVNLNWVRSKNVCSPGETGIVDEAEYGVVLQTWGIYMDLPQFMAIE